MTTVWQVAMILDPSGDQKLANTLSGYMPVWVVDTPDNATYISIARGQGHDCTSFKVTDPYLRESNLLSNIETVELHHSSLTCLHVVGIESSDRISAKLADFGYVPAQQYWPEALSFRKVVIDWSNAPNFHLDANNWKTSNDFYDALFAALNSPPWHGRNFNALHDSIVTGQINGIEVPYRFVMSGIEKATSEVQIIAKDFIALINDFENRGCPVSIVAEPELP